MLTGEALGNAAVAALPLLRGTERQRVARLLAQMQGLDARRRRLCLELLGALLGAVKDRTPTPETARLAQIVEEACVLVTESLRRAKR